MIKTNIKFWAGVEYKDKLYAVSPQINGLFQLDLATKEMTYIKKFLKEESPLEIYWNAYLYKKEAWFTPGKGKYIAVVNLETFDIRYYDLPFIRRNNMDKLIIQSVYYSGGIINKRFLYLIPSNVDTLLLIDLEKKQFYPFYDVAKPKECLIYGSYFNQKIYMIPYIGKELVVVNLHTKQIERYPWKWPFETFTGFISYKNRLWLIPGRANFLLSLDIHLKETEKIPLGAYYTTNQMYYEAFIIDDDLFMLPFSSSKMLKYNIRSKHFFQIDLRQNWLKRNKITLKKMSTTNRIILTEESGHMLLIYDKERESLEKIELSIDTKFLLQNLNRNDIIKISEFYNSDCYLENSIGLQNFFEIIAEPHIAEKKEFFENIGAKIWKGIHT